MNTKQIEKSAFEKMVKEGYRLFECEYIQKDRTKDTIILTLDEMIKNTECAVAPEHPYFNQSAYRYITDCKEITMDYMRA